MRLTTPRSSRQGSRPAIDDLTVSAEKFPPQRAIAQRFSALQHRSGLANYYDLKAYHDAVARGDEPWSVPVLLEQTQADRLRYAPGHGWAYSNIGYLIVRQLIERVYGDDLGVALAKLVLLPLGITDARFAHSPADLAGVTMGARAYHPGWVYHGLIIGPLRAAPLLLDRLMTGVLLSSELLDQMCNPYQIGGPVPGRPWKAPAYGLGLMCGITASGTRAIGHTGGGPSCVITVYHLPEAAIPFTAASFAFGDNQALVEAAAFTRGSRRN